jgi:hypothetical protein
MWKLFKKKKSVVSFCDACGWVCDDGCRKDAVLSALWEQAHHYSYGGRP